MSIKPTDLSVVFDKCYTPDQIRVWLEEIDSLKEDSNLMRSPSLRWSHFCQDACGDLHLSLLRHNNFDNSDLIEKDIFNKKHMDDVQMKVIYAIGDRNFKAMKTNMELWYSLFRSYEAKLIKKWAPIFIGVGVLATAWFSLNRKDTTPSA